MGGRDLNIHGPKVSAEAVWGARTATAPEDEKLLAKYKALPVEKAALWMILIGFHT